jgi:hypothetical protein
MTMTSTFASSTHKNKVVSTTPLANSPSKNPMKKSSCPWDQRSTATVDTTEEFSDEASTLNSVPRSLWLSQSLRENAKTIPTIPLVPLNCTFGVINQRPAVTMKVALKQERKVVLHKFETKSNISIVFAVRHPGCPQCREHGLQLSEMVASGDSLLQNVNLWGIVKEVGLQQDENKGLLNFYDNYFHFPLYMDNKWNVYKAMGGRKLTIVSIIKHALMARSRWAKKGICSQSSACGEALMQGGVLIFKDGRLRFAMEEKFGKELETDDIRAAIKALKEEDETFSTDSSSVSSGSLLSGHEMPQHELESSHLRFL